MVVMLGDTIPGEGGGGAERRAPNHVSIRVCVRIYIYIQVYNHIQAQKERVMFTGLQGQHGHALFWPRDGAHRPGIFSQFQVQVLPEFRRADERPGKPLPVLVCRTPVAWHRNSKFRGQQMDACTGFATAMPLD